MIPSKDAIVAGMEKLQKEQELSFTIPETFGGGVAIIQLNPDAGKRYILKVAKDLDAARGSAPYWSHDKAKHIAKWVADRLGSLTS
ncbi:MAG: hypothetical protein AB1512_23135 [Thermodesulfobacteriota bacterium]